jgi:hypothetical protein
MRRGESLNPSRALGIARNTLKQYLKRAEDAFL